MHGFYGFDRLMLQGPLQIAQPPNFLPDRLFGCGRDLLNLAVHILCVSINLPLHGPQQFKLCQRRHQLGLLPTAPTPVW